MQHFSCDVCGTIIKSGQRRHLILQQDILVRDIPAKSIHEAYIQAQTDSSYVQPKELCPRCKHVLDYLFNMRKEKLEELTKELEDSFHGISETEIPPKNINHLLYCQCGDKFEDEGELKEGHPNGICYICGKFKEEENKNE